MFQYLQFVFGIYSKDKTQHWSLFRRRSHFLPGKVSEWLRALSPEAGQGAPPPSAPRARSSRLRSNKILLWVFSGDTLGVSLVVEREILAVLLFDARHLLVSVRLFSSVEESDGHRQDSHDHKDHHGDDACNEEDSYSGSQTFGEIYVFITWSLMRFSVACLA